MGRSLLNVPHEVLLDQAVDLRDHLRVAERTRRVIDAVGLDGDALLARLEENVREGRAARTEDAMAQLGEAELVDRRNQWRRALADWRSRLSLRLVLARGIDQAPTAAALRAALPRDGSRRFASSLAALDASLAVLSAHGASLGVAQWTPDLVAEAWDLRGQATIIVADEPVVEARSRAATDRIQASRAALQVLIREVRVASDLATRADPLVSVRPLDVLAAYVAARTPQKSESEAVVEESGPVVEESGPVVAKSGAVVDESGPVGREWGAVVEKFEAVGRESKAVAGLRNSTTAIDSLTTASVSETTVVHSRTTVVDRSTTGTNFGTTASNLRPTAIDSALPAPDSLSGAREAP